MEHVTPLRQLICDKRAEQVVLKVIHSGQPVAIVGGANSGATMMLRIISSILEKEQLDNAPVLLEDINCIAKNKNDLMLSVVSNTPVIFSGIYRTPESLLTDLNAMYKANFPDSKNNVMSFLKYIIHITKENGRRRVKTIYAITKTGNITILFSSTLPVKAS